MEGQSPTVCLGALLRTAGGQDVNKWLDVKKVNVTIPINIGFELKRLIGQKRNERCDVEKVNDNVQVNSPSNPESVGTEN